MKILVTGASGGIGSATVRKFLEDGHEVVGFDIENSVIKESGYTHYQVDILNGVLPEIDGVEILINNAGVQDSGKDIDVNLKGTIKVTEKYGIRDGIKSIVFVASASATTGSEFPEYVASKGGVVAYMKNVALRVAEFGATANSVSPGGVLTKLNDRVILDKQKWQLIMNETPLKKWATAEEIADWIYFVSVINRSMTAQDIIVDNGESSKANFVW